MKLFRTSDSLDVSTVRLVIDFLVSFIVTALLIVGIGISFKMDLSELFIDAQEVLISLVGLLVLRKLKSRLLHLGWLLIISGFLVDLLEEFKAYISLPEFFKYYQDFSLTLGLLIIIYGFYLVAKELRDLSINDELTGLLNRRGFLQRLEKCSMCDKRKTFMYIDLDKFKRVNDTLGHDMGDLLLQKIAIKLKGCIRDVDALSRMGGDEFLIMLCDLNEKDIAKVTLRIAKLFEEPIKIGEKEIDIAASIGVSSYPRDEADINKVIKKADKAMYYAKNNGLKYKIYDKDMDRIG